jgi:hypothetical protein
MTPPLSPPSSDLFRLYDSSLNQLFPSEDSAPVTETQIKTHTHGEKRSRDEVSEESLETGPPTKKAKISNNKNRDPVNILFGRVSVLNFPRWRAPISNVFSYFSQNPSDWSSCRLTPKSWKALPILNIFFHLGQNLSDWRSCSLTCKSWKAINDRVHPLIVAIKMNQVETVKSLLQKGASVKLTVEDSYPTINVDCTPYICAKELNHEEIAVLLKDEDSEFSHRYIKNKLIAMCAQTNAYFHLEGHSFSGEGLGHFAHHEYLTVQLIHSLKFFFTQYTDSKYWDEEKTKKLVSWLEASSCLSCMSPEQLEKTQSRFKTEKGIFLSDTAIFNHMHWVNIVALDSWIATGNRGRGSEDTPGVKIYKMTQGFTFESLPTLFPKFSIEPKEVSLVAYLPMPRQISGSCSRTSLEAGILAAIFLLLMQMNENKVDQKTLEEEAKKIFKAWEKYDQISFSNQIMDEKQVGDYDPVMLSRASAVFTACDQTTERFFHFLLSRGITPWSDPDNKSKSPTDYALERHNTPFLNLVANRVKGKEAQDFLSKALAAKNYVVAETLFKNGVEIDGNDAYAPYQSPFWSMLIAKNIAGLEWLLEHGANPNQKNMNLLVTCRDENYKYPLNYIELTSCCISHNPEVAKVPVLLLKYGAKMCKFN